MFALLKKRLKQIVSKFKREDIEVLEKLEEEKPAGKSEEIEKGEKRKIEKGETEEREKTKKEEVKRKEKPILARVLEIDLTERKIAKLIDELKIALIENDVAIEVANEICESVKKQLIGKRCKRGEVEKVVKHALKQAILHIFESCEKVDLMERIEKAKREKGFATLVFLGFNGVGKTLTLAKVAYLLKKHGYRCLLAAADTFRAAAIEQLSEHAQKLGVEIVKQIYGADPCAVVYDAREKARARGYDVVLADTAGRSHASRDLMRELQKICRVNQPDLKILVLDSLTGNDVVEQARRFHEAVGVDAIIMTKADVYEKGGSALSACFAIRRPIIYLGTGQTYKDLVEFDAKKAVDELVG